MVIAPLEISPVSRMLAWYIPGERPRMVMSKSVSVGETCTILAKPLTTSVRGVVGLWVSRMATAAP